MAHRNLESQENRKLEIELNLRMRFDQKRSKIGTVTKWIASLLAKIAIHYLVLWLHVW